MGGNTLRFLRRYPEALDAYRRANNLAPEVVGYRINVGLTYARWTGELDTLRSVLVGLSPDADLGAVASAREMQIQLLLWERKPDSVLMLLEDLRGGVLASQNFYTPTALIEGWAHTMREDALAASKAFGTARSLLDSVVLEQPRDVRVRAARGLALAGIGDRLGALREAHWLEQSESYRRDAFGGKNTARDRALILVQVEEADAALDEIERLLANPSPLSVPLLRLDPLWDPIRDNPRFRTLLETYEN